MFKLFRFWYFFKYWPKSWKRWKCVITLSIIQHLQLVKNPDISSENGTIQFIKFRIPRGTIKGVAMLDGARVKKKVCRSHVRSQGLSEANVQLKEILVTLLGHFGGFGAPILIWRLGNYSPLPPSLSPWVWWLVLEKNSNVLIWHLNAVMQLEISCRLWWLYARHRQMSKKVFMWKKTFTA